MPIPLEIDRGADVPRHRQVYEAVRSAILSGAYAPGDRLPSSRLLARHLALSRATVTEAYEQLRAEGYLQGQQGSGTYVAPGLTSTALPPGMPPAPASPPIPLSSWGERLRGAAFSLPLTVEGSALPFDLRPHRIAVDVFPWAEWRAAVETTLQEEQSGLLMDPSPAGHPLLRETIAEHVRRYRSVDCTAQSIVIVNGARQGFNLLSHLLLERGDRVAVEDPGYPAARIALETRGLDVQHIRVDGEGMVVSDLRNHPPFRLVHVTPSHQDPTGMTMSLTRRLALLELAESTGCIILEDDYDSEFRYEGRPVESLQGLDRRGGVVYAGTFSKSVLAGLRIGFVILPPSLLLPAIRARALWDGGAPTLESGALARFMLSGGYERHIRRMRRVYRSRRDALIHSLRSRLEGRVEVGERHGGLNLLVSFRSTRTDEDIARRAADLGLALRTARPYYTVPPSHPTFLLGFGALREERADEAVRLLATAGWD